MPTFQIHQSFSSLLDLLLRFLVHSLLRSSVPRPPPSHLSPLACPSSSSPSDRPPAMEAVAEAEMRNGASSVVSPLVRPSPSVRGEQCLAAEEEGRKEGRKEGGEPRPRRPDEENRARSAFGRGETREGGRESDSENRQLKCTASCHGLRGGGGEHERLRLSRVFIHDTVIYWE